MIEMTSKVKEKTGTEHSEESGKESVTKLSEESAKESEAEQKKKSKGPRVRKIRTKKISKGAGSQAETRTTYTKSGRRIKPIERLGIL